MTIGLLIITHEHIGATILETATKMLGMCPVATEILAVPLDSDPEEILRRASLLVRRLDDGSGVVVLTDMYGSTPANIARHLLEGHNVRVISGINLPMVVRILNYSNLDLHEVACKACEGGRDGVILCDGETSNSQCCEEK